MHSITQRRRTAAAAAAGYRMTAYATGKKERPMTCISLVLPAELALFWFYTDVWQGSSIASRAEVFWKADNGRAAVSKWLVW